MNISNPGGQSIDNEIIKWIKKRMKENMERYGMDYMEEYPYDVMLSYPIGDNKVKIFCISLRLFFQKKNFKFYFVLFDNTFILMKNNIKKLKQMKIMKI